MIKSKKLWFTLIAAIYGINSYAYDFEADNICYTIISTEKETVKVAEKSVSDGYSGIITIPSTVEYAGIYFTVTDIEPKAFYNCQELEKVVLPGTIKYVKGFRLSSVKEVELSEGSISIENDCFSDCDKLESIALPGSITGIGENAFWSCDLLSDVSLSESLEVIGKNAFSECSSLKEIFIPAGVYDIKDNAFMGSNLESVTFAGGKNIVLNNGAFRNTPLREINLSSVVRIGDYTFAGTQLTTLVCGENLTRIGEYAFSETPIESVEINPGITAIGLGAFENSNLTEADLGQCSSLSKLDGTFYRCRKLTKVILPEGVVEIGAYTFSECNMLSNIDLPEGVEIIGMYAFEKCGNLSQINIPESINGICGGAFNDCLSLTHFEFPARTWIHLYDADGIFEGCINLKSLKLPGVDLPRYKLFYSLDKLEDISAVYGYNNFVPEVFGEMFNDATYNNAILRVPDGTLDLYKGTWPWMQFLNITEDSDLQTVGLDNTSPDKQTLLYSEESVIAPHVDSLITIYDSTGTIVMRSHAESGKVYVGNLLPGLYIATTDDMSVLKFVVR